MKINMDRFLFFPHFCDQISLSCKEVFYFYASHYSLLVFLRRRSFLKSITSWMFRRNCLQIPIHRTIFRLPWWLLWLRHLPTMTNLKSKPGLIGILCVWKHLDWEKASKSRIAKTRNPIFFILL